MSKILREYYEERDVRSRYTDDKRLEFDDGDACIETPDRISFRRSNEDKMFTVEAGFENRLDIISWKVYGSPLYWWAIAMASDIEDPFDIPIGTILTCPPLYKIRGR